MLNQREIKKLKDMESFRREFLGEVSHELKTPIFAVQGFIHTLMDGAIDDDKVRIKFLKKAMKNADRLSNLVQDLLIITQAESGEMELRIRKFEIYELVQEVIDSLEHKFTKKRRQISCTIEANHHEHTRVLADRERIQQVLTNLLDNAVKYGNQDGDITIRLEAHDHKLYTSIQDNGPGIESEHLEKIFRRFYRVDKSRSRERGGTGLGLAICKHLLKMHGEQITAESEPGKGTTFAFSLKMGN
jgi:two-component system phosphate regulon sensor histidine kinase PhoR